MSNNKFHHEQIYRGDLTPLTKKKITVCGCGAIGSNLIDMLVRQGFTQIRAIDKDRVEVHNLNTQTFDMADVGSMKVNAVRNKAFRAVETEVEIVSQELTQANVKKHLKGSDLVIDAFDNTASRQLLQTHCRAEKLNCLHAGLAADYAEVVWDEVYRVPQDGGEDICDYPLARNLVLMVVAMACEEIVDFCLKTKSRRQSWSITLKDLAVRSYR